MFPKWITKLKCMKTKINKESRNLLIAMLLGDGTISNNNVFKMMHSSEQTEYLLWKINLLKESGLRNNGFKSYVSKGGYKPGSTMVYTQLNIIPFIKTLRRVFYKPKKNIGNRKLLNRLDAQGIAIWYMDDGHINIRKTGDKIHGFYIKISTCESKEDVQIVIDYFKEMWNVNFYMFKEGRDTFSLCCGTKEGLKFIQIVEPYVKQIPSMHYKIQFDLSQRQHPIIQDSTLCSNLNCEIQDTTLSSEDIV